MKHNPLPRLDKDPEIKTRLLAHCRLQPGETWVDPQGRHRVGCLDATDPGAMKQFFADAPAPTLAIHDPPYNLVAFEARQLQAYIDWCRAWVQLTWDVLAENGAMYVWLGADQRNHFQPLPDFMLMMREQPFSARSFVTMRNQRGYGTQHNWMAVRQELLYYVKGKPPFTVQYTKVPKRLAGYYKEIDGEMTDNLARGKSDYIRAGNVWIDVQQVFYRMAENVSGCFAQKPLQAIRRIVQAGSQPDEVVTDFFSHSGTTLLAAEQTDRRCFTVDIDPVFAEITIRRLEHYRETGQPGWQHSNPFENDFGLQR